jgi:hypothetical protein
MWREFERFARVNAAIVFRAWTVVDAAFLSRRPRLGDEQTRIGGVQLEHIADTAAAEVDSVDAFGKFPGQPNPHQC